MTGRCKTDYEECIDIVQLMVGRDFNHSNALKKHHDVSKNLITFHVVSRSHTLIIIPKNSAEADLVS